uniref:Uncharacterized protein n=1 Tax=Acrobeloides nanus TaxID=290746 RepID=A0A914E0F5_9BILA
MSRHITNIRYDDSFSDEFFFEYRINSNGGIVIIIIPSELKDHPTTFGELMPCDRAQNLKHFLLLRHYLKI